MCVCLGVMDVRLRSSLGLGIAVIGERGWWWMGILVWTEHLRQV